MNQAGSDLQENAEAPLEEHWLPSELSAEAQRKLEWAGKIRDARSDGNRALEKQLIQEAAKALACHPRTITRMLSAVEIDGLIALARDSRSDKGEARYISEPWRNLVVELYKRGNKYSRRTNRHQIWLLIQAITTKLESTETSTEASVKALFDWTATKLGSVEESHTSVLNKILKAIREEVSAGEMNPPRSHVAIYKILRAYSDAKNKKARHPGQGPVKVIKTTDGDITVDRSNKVLQIDHTPLDVLVVDQNGEEIGSPFLSVAVDSYSGCIAGYYLGFRQPSSLEVALVLRHAILPKRYGAEYELQKNWAVRGVPEYLVTDRAKEFKSQHLSQVATHLGFSLRYRFMPEQGGIVESVFDKLNKELNSRFPGYKGSNVQKRPEDAEKYASLTIEELEKFLVRHFVDHVNQHAYPGVAQTRAQRWDAMMVEAPRVPEERDLDLCLLKQNKRPKVQKFGTIQFEGEIYKGECLLDYVTKNVVVRYNPANIIHLLIYTCEEQGQAGKFVGVVQARDLKDEHLSLKELKDRKRKLRAGVKALDTSSILDERLALNQFTEEKVRETRKQRRHKEHERTGRSSGLSNIVEFKRQEADTKVKASSTEALLSPTNETKPQRKRYQPSGDANIAVADWNQHLQTNW